MRSASFTRRLAPTSRPSGRSGATLTEVLMAILIMAVGVVSVFTLFPISVLRTIQATNQTNARILKDNAEEQVSQSPELVFQFTPSTANPGPASPLAGVTMQGEWQPQRNPAYVVGDVVVPTIKPGSTIPRPLAYFQVSAVNPAGSTSGLIEPLWNPQATAITDGGLTWIPVSFSRYVIDPLGLNIARADGQPNRVVDTFGNKTTRNTGVPTAFAPADGQLVRIHGGLTHPTDIQVALFKAADTCVHPDSWQQLIEATPTGVSDFNVTFPASVDLTGIFPAAPALVNPRVVLTTLDGSQTVVREMNAAPAGQVASWANTEGLPARFLAAPIGLARIEVYNRRYAWFLTVRNVGDRPEIKCVVTFNRSGAPAEEHAYNANFGNANIDTNGDGFDDGDINEDGTVDAADGNWSRSGQIVISWTATEPEPLIKAGNWLFDARDVSWYRIQSVDTDLTGATSARVTLDRPVRALTVDATTANIGRAILMPGIVEVFDL